MARLVLPYISFIVFLLLMCMATQPGTGTIHSDEGQDILCSAIYLSIYIFLHIFISYIGSTVLSDWTSIHALSQLCSTLEGVGENSIVGIQYIALIDYCYLIDLVLYRCIMCVSVCLFLKKKRKKKKKRGFYKEVLKTSNNFITSY